MLPRESGEAKGQSMKGDVAHLDDLVYPILYVAGQGGCDGVGKVRDPKGLCNILGRGSERKNLGRKTAYTP
jgi:hypothetical protein